MALEPAERIGLVAHEAWHVALMHMLRRGTMDSNYFNIAGDYVINQLLVDNQFTIPSGGYQDNRFRGMSTNDVYDIIFKEQPPKNGGQAHDLIYVEANPDKSEGKQPSQTEIEQLKLDIKSIVIQAATQSRMQGEQAGNIPGEIVRAIDHLLHPILPWEQILNRFLTEKVKSDYSWQRPNKRFMPDFYLPTQYSEALEHLTFAIDTSGSVSKKDLQAMLSEIEYIRDTLKPTKLTIIDCDHKIHHIHNVTEDQDILDLTFTGGGGTSCYPVMEYCKDNPTTALIYFTDLYLREYDKPVDFPVLWIVYNNPNATTNIGEITHYKIGK